MKGTIASRAKVPEEQERVCERKEAGLETYKADTGTGLMCRDEQRPKVPAMGGHLCHGPLRLKSNTKIVLPLIRRN